MRQRIFTLFILSATALLSCRKTSVEPDIKQYDQSQMENYISAHGLTGMKSAGDTTGMYYQIINPGDSVINGTPVPPLDYPDQIRFVFTLRSFDGKFVSSDTIANHFDDYLGHIAPQHKLPAGLQLGIRNFLKYRGGSMRLLIPSHLAYGVSGYGSGSILNTNSRIPGNQCLDYYVHLMGNTPTDNQATYDDLVIRNYMLRNNLTGYTKVQSTTLPGNYYYYKIETPGTPPTAPLTDSSSIVTTYTGQLLDGTLFDSTYNGTNSKTFVIADLGIPGVKEPLQNNSAAGAKISILLPSALGYGEAVQGNNPPNSCLRFTYAISSVTP
ncbi:MAG: FKBP-type peptidyl-prolyl cis-trans isomerase [Sphingobacteriales bacterium]